MALERPTPEDLELLGLLSDDMKGKEPGSEERGERLAEIKQLLGRMFGDSMDVS